MKSRTRAFLHIVNGDCLEWYVGAPAHQVAAFDRNQADYPAHQVAALASHPKICKAETYRAHY